MGDASGPGCLGGAGFAASPCVNQLLNWDTYATGAAPRSATLGTTTVSWSLAYRTGTTAGTQSGTVQAGPKGGTNENYFRLGMNGVTSTSSMSMTITFSQPVTNLTFKIADIDYLSGGQGWSDRVWLSFGFTTTFTGTYIDSATTGTSATTAWRSTYDGDVTGSQNFGRVDVRYAGPVSSVTINYFNGGRSSGATNTHIGLTDLAFCA